jgi:hypothetical protein
MTVVVPYTSSDYMHDEVLAAVEESRMRVLSDLICLDYFPFFSESVNGDTRDQL